MRYFIDDLVYYLTMPVRWFMLLFVWRKHIAACQAAFRAAGIDPALEPDPCVDRYAWHVHHRILGERLTHPVDDRISCILWYKRLREVTTRLTRFRPILQDPTHIKCPRWAGSIAEHSDATRKAHAHECGCDWYIHENLFSGRD